MDVFRKDRQSFFGNVRNARIQQTRKRKELYRVITESEERMMIAKKISALILALVMVFMMSTALAATLTNGEVGGYTTADTQNVDDKTIRIEKDIIVYNPDAAFVYGPSITYTYTIAAGTAGVSITDATSDHASGTSTNTTTLAGVGVGSTLKINSAVSATGTIAWSNSEVVDASPAGTVNTKYLTLDFTDVVFTQPGVYRYRITETADAYTTSGVSETWNTTDDTAASHIRYLDVYVMRSATYGTDGSGNASTVNAAHWWKVYGYVCVYNDSTAIVDGDAGHAVKTNGFVSGTSNGTKTVVADEYHTYNLTVGKTLTGDATMNSHGFPFDVTWTAGDATGTFQFIAETSASGVAFESGTITDVAAASANAAGSSVNGTAVAAHKKVGGGSAVGTAGKDGNPSIANGGWVTYIGIPCGTKVTVTETNNVTGTTYTTTATETVGSGTATAVAFDASSTASRSADSKKATAEDGTTVVYAQAAAPAADTDVVIQYTNTLAVISPTGLVLRFAPYALILAAGIALFVIFAVRRRKHAEEEE